MKLQETQGILLDSQSTYFGGIFVQFLFTFPRLVLQPTYYGLCLCPLIPASNQACEWAWLACCLNVLHDQNPAPPPSPPSEAEFMNAYSLRFLGIILRVLRLTISVYMVFLNHREGGKVFYQVFLQSLREFEEIARRKTLKTFVWISSKNAASGHLCNI